LKISDKDRLLAFIPARGGSKRFPKKNIAKFLEYPLIYYPIKEALKSKIFFDVIVSTDDNKILSIAKQFGASTILRSKKNSSDTAHELEACREYFRILKKQNKPLPTFFCVIYPTAVLIKSKDFKYSYNLIKNKKNVDVVMGVSMFNYHPYKALVVSKKGYLTPIFKKKYSKRSQTYDEMYASNGTFIWHRTKSFLEKKYLGHYAENLIGYKINSKVPMDIDFKKDLDYLNDFFKPKKK